MGEALTFEGKKRMKNLFASIFCALLLASAAQAQTLTLDRTAVEVITAGAKTRAFYPLDECYMSYKAPTLTVYDVRTASILFQGDTSLVTITGVTLWSAKLAKLNSWMLKATTTTGYTWYLPKRGLNYLYRTSDNSATVISQSTKNTLLKTHVDSIYVTGVSGVSNKLAWLRSRAQMDQIRYLRDIGETPTIAAGAAAGTSPTVAIGGGTLAGRITLTTGSSPTTTGVLCTVTLPVTFPTGTIVNITAADSDSGAHIARIFVDSTTSAFTLNASGTALSASTQYIINYSVAGY